MIHLEIRHPEREQVALPLRDGVYLFPPAGLWTEESARGRLRVQVRQDCVRIEALGDSDPLRLGDEECEEVELGPGDSVRFGHIELTCRVGSRSRAPVARPMAVESHDTALDSAIGTSPPSRVLAAPTATTPSRHIGGRDRWIVIGLLAIGRLGRRELARVVTAWRNASSSGSKRNVAEILCKERFLGAEFDPALQELDAGWSLSCSECRRVFEPDGRVLESFRCLECDRRLTVVPRTVGEIAAERRSPSLLHTKFDRLPSGVRLGNYRLERLLGIGGYGAVYQAVDHRIGRTVALKVFPASEESGGEVLREARNVAAFPAHPNLVMVYHVGEALGFNYICYEYVKGRSLAYHIERRGSLPLELGLVLFKDSLRGLAAAHKFGVIHRDLKPDNILLVQTSGRLRAKVTDFGLGKQLQRGQGVYHSRTIRGAPEYLAPEQFRSQASSVASDLYSIGATFFHVLTGQQPFVGASDWELAERHQLDPVPSLSALLPNCPPALDRLFQRLLEKDPTERPSSAAAVLDLFREVEAQIDDQRSEQTRRSGTRTVTVVGLVVVPAVLVMLGLIANRSQDAAVDEKTPAAPVVAEREDEPVEGAAGDAADDPATTTTQGAVPHPLEQMSEPPPLIDLRALGDEPSPYAEGARAATFEVRVRPTVELAAGPAEDEATEDDGSLAVEVTPSEVELPVVSDPARRPLPEALSGFEALVTKAASVLTEKGVDLSAPDLSESRWGSEEQVVALEWRRLGLLHFLFADVGSLQFNATHECTFLQSFARPRLTYLDGRPSEGGLLYKVEDIQGRMSEVRALLESLGLQELVHIALPTIKDLESDVVRRLDVQLPSDLREWVQEEGEPPRSYMLERGEFDESIRPSTYRWKIRVKSLESLERALTDALGTVDGEAVE